MYTIIQLQPSFCDEGLYTRGDTRPALTRLDPARRSAIESCKVIPLGAPLYREVHSYNVDIETYRWYTIVHSYTVDASRHRSSVRDREM